MIFETRGLTSPPKYTEWRGQNSVDSTPEVEVLLEPEEAGLGRDRPADHTPRGSWARLSV